MATCDSQTSSQEITNVCPVRHCQPRILGIHSWDSTMYILVQDDQKWRFHLWVFLALTLLHKLRKWLIYYQDHASGVTTWSAIETNTGLVCACAPYLRLLVVKMKPQTTKNSFQTISSDPSNRFPSKASSKGTDKSGTTLVDSYVSRSNNSLELMEKGYGASMSTVSDTSPDLSMDSSHERKTDFVWMY